MKIDTDVKIARDGIQNKSLFPVWNKEKLKEIHEMLGIKDESLHEWVQLVLQSSTDDYWIKKGFEMIRPTTPEKRKAYEQISKHAEKLVHTLAGLEANSEMELIDELLMITDRTEVERTLDFMQLDEMKVMLLHLSKSANQLLMQVSSGRGPKENVVLKEMVNTLLVFYERITGEKATHNPRDEVGYDGVPRSRAGRFVLAVFEFIDKDVANHPSKISSILEEYVRNRNATDKLH